MVKEREVVDVVVRVQNSVVVAVVVQYSVVVS